MIIYIVLCGVLQTCLCHVKSTQKMTIPTVGPKLDRDIYKKTAELIYSINKIYSHNEDEEHNLEVSTDQSRTNQISLKQLMKLIQKNYDASKVYKNVPKVRVHIISNPGALKQFQNILKDRESVNSLKDYRNSSNRKLKDIIRNLRRQAVFRIDDSVSEENLVAEEELKIKGIQYSVEDKSEKIIKHEEATAIQNRKKEVESEEKADIWDVITKKYDWEVNEENILEDDKKKHTKREDKKSKVDVIGYDKIKHEDKWDNWGQNIKKTKKKDAFKLDYWEQKDVKITPKIGNLGQKYDRKNNKRDNKNNVSWNDRGNNKKESAKTRNDFNKPKPDKAKIDTKLIEPKNKRKESEIKENKQNKWNKKDNWDNWKQTTRERRTTKRQNKVSFKINEWEHYVPIMKEKPKRYEHERKIPVGAFGRTSIPFAGKKSIYEENK